MRIAMLSDDWWPVTGGGPAHVKSLSIALAKHFGDEVDVYTRQLRDGDERYTATEYYADGQVRVIRLGPCTEYWNLVGRVASTVTPLPRLLANDYDVIHGHTYLPAIPLRLAGSLMGTPTVFTVHGMPLTSDDESRGGQSGPSTSKDGLTTLWDRLTDQAREWAISQLVLGFDYDSVISVNRSNVARLEANHDDVTYIPNGVDVERFGPDAAPDGTLGTGTDTASAIDSDRKKVLYLGRLDPQKRVGDLIDAFATVADEFPDWDLVIVGSGRSEADLRQRASQSPVADRIHFTGKVSDEEVTRQYASAELFVLPSRWEGHPLSLLEAWASGLPVVASDVTGIREFVEHRENGYLVDSQTPEALTEGLRYAFRHPDEAREWAREGRKQVHEEFTWERCAERTRRVYRSVAEGRPESGSGFGSDSGSDFGSDSDPERPVQ